MLGKPACASASSISGPANKLPEYEPEIVNVKSAPAFVAAFID